MAPGDLLRAVRSDAGLTQSELARRMGTTQTAIARMERRDSNPTVATLSRAFRAAGRELVLEAVSPSEPVDADQLSAHLAMTPTERVRRHDAAYRNTARMMRGIARTS